MRFESVKIENYRQYRSLDLEFGHGGHDLQVLVADNGVGKTNLLNAFTWCLYGEEPHLGLQPTGSQNGKEEPKLNKEVIAEYQQAGKKSAQVLVQIDIDLKPENGKPSLLRVKRTVPFSVSSDSCFERKPETHLSVVRMGSHDEVLEGQRAQDLINRYLPRDIREYFFFDGEQLGSYFKENTGDRIKRAVQSISQIDLVTQMTDRLNNVLRDVRSQAGGVSSDAEKYRKFLEDAERTLRGCETVITEKERDVANLQQQIDEISDQLRGTKDVGQLERKRSELHKTVRELKGKLISAKLEYYKFARDRVVDFYMYPAARQTVDAIKTLEDDGQLPPPVAPEYLKQMLEQGHCAVCGHELTNDELEAIRAELDKYKVDNGTVSLLYNIKGDLMNVCNRVKAYKRERRSAFSQVDYFERQLGKTEEDLEAVEREMAAIGDSADKIKRLQESRVMFERELSEANQVIGARTVKKCDMERKVEKYKKLLEKALKEDAAARKYSLEHEFGSKALEVLKSAKEGVVNEVRANVSSRTEDLFKNMIWKESKCDHVELTDNYRPKLYDKSGYSCEATGSAAERSLLALAFTLALHEVSRNDAPLFIDTPIARVSGENRKNFARTLVDVSRGKQLILAFTPSEYSEEIREEFEPTLATYIRLKMDENESRILDPEVDYRGN